MPLDSLNLGFVVPLNIEFSIMYFILGMRWPNAIGIRIGQTICGLSNTLYSAFCLALRQGFSTYPGLSCNSPSRPGWPQIYRDIPTPKEVLCL